MSEGNVEFVVGIFDAVDGTDKEALLAALPDLVPQLCDPDVEWIEDPSRADSRTYRGHAGVIESWRRWLETFKDWEVEIERITDCGDDVFVAMREHGTGALSEAPVGATNYAVITVRDGKIRRYREFYDEATALETAGLSEQAMSEENVELVRRLFTIWNRTSGVGEEAADLAGEFFDPDVEWHDQRELPGATVHHGIEEVGRHLAASQEALDYERTDLLELLDADPRVIAAYRFHARGRSSGTPVERDAFHVYSFRGARIACVEIFGTRSEALEAAGLSE